MKIYGAEDKSHVIGTNALEWIHPDYHEKAKSSIGQIIADVESP
jgi:hypothetical protein